MLNGKRILLIAGGGTLGTYTGEELLRLGATVEVICPEEKVSTNERLIFHRAFATDEVLTKLFAKNRYYGKKRDQMRFTYYKLQRGNVYEQRSSNNFGK